MKSSLRCIAAGILVLPCAAQAGFYLGGSGVASDFDYDDTDTGAGWRAYLGYVGEVFPMFLEAGWVDTGEADIQSFGATDVEIEFSGYQVGAGFLIPLSGTGSGLWTKASYYDGETELEAPGGGIPAFPTGRGRFEADTDGASIAAGFTWKFTREFGIRGEYEHLFDVEDVNDERNLHLFMLGLILELRTSRGGSASADYGPAYGRPAPAPYYTPASPYAPPIAPASLPPGAGAAPPGAIPLAPVPIAPAPATPPAASVSVAPDPTSAPASPKLPNAGTATALKPLAIRARPRIDAGPEGTLPAGTAVTLRQQRSNAEGRWWYVEHENLSGWASESDLRL